MLIAWLGNKLVIVDLAAIEARVLAWIAGQWDLVSKFANNEEIYCGFATKVLGWNVRKPKKDGAPGYIKAIEDRHKWARNAIGKIGILGCGYGMGTDRIFEYAGGAVDLETADKIKVTYRETNPQIVQFWKDIEKAFIYTAKYRKPCELPRGLRFDSAEDCDVIITLPCGRELHYHKVKLVADDYGDKIEVYNEMERHWGHVWGGHLTENVVQAMSRDILMEACVALEAAGHHTALRVHDELVLVAQDEKAEACLNATLAAFRTPPAWAKDCPLNAEGVIKQQYGGH